LLWRSLDKIVIRKPPSFEQCRQRLWSEIPLFSHSGGLGIHEAKIAETANQLAGFALPLAES
jgi:hypothetical protein